MFSLRSILTSLRSILTSLRSILTSLRLIFFGKFARCALGTLALQNTYTFCPHRTMPVPYGGIIKGKAA
jgi:hypothetical protein